MGRKDPPKNTCVSPRFLAAKNRPQNRAPPAPQFNVGLGAYGCCNRSMRRGRSVALPGISFQQTLHARRLRVTRKRLFFAAPTLSWGAGGGGSSRPALYERRRGRPEVLRVRVAFEKPRKNRKHNWARNRGKRMDAPRALKATLCTVR